MSLPHLSNLIQQAVQLITPSAQHTICTAQSTNHPYYNKKCSAATSFVVIYSSCSNKNLAAQLYTD